MTQRETTDAVVMEIIRHGMLQASEEMKLKLMRASIDPLIYIVKDFSCGVFNSHGELVAQSLGLPHFLANLGRSISAIAEDIGGLDKFEDGDVYMTNDPYRVVLHVPDVDVLIPVFHRGSLIGFTASRAHWTDVGAANPFTNAATEIFQEGVVYRSVKAYQGGVPIPSVLRVIRENSRLPESSERNLRAQVAAGLAGKARMLAAVAKYGQEPFEAAMQGILRHGEMIARQVVRDIPDGVYGDRWQIDNDSLNLDRPLDISVRVVISGDEFTVDLEGSPPPGPGCMNLGREQTVTECRMAFASLLPSGFPVNEGVFRPLKVRIPGHSMFNAKTPSATSSGYQAGDVVKDLIQSALAKVLPDRICAPNYGNACNTMLSGHSEDGRYYCCVSNNAGGGGGKPYEDGEDAFIFGDLANIPVEVREKLWPLRVERYELAPDSEGAGKYRGGFGLVEDVRFLGDEGRLTTWIARYNVPTFGILGGESPPPNWAMVNPETAGSRDIPRVTGFHVAKGDVIRLMCSGGGGYGNPLDRDPELVREDVRLGLVSAKRAKDVYGVVLAATGRSFQIDAAATEALRGQISAAREGEQAEGKRRSSLGRGHVGLCFLQ